MMVRNNLLSKMTLRVPFLQRLSPRSRKWSVQQDGQQPGNVTVSGTTQGVMQRMTREKALEWGQSFKALIESRDGRIIFREFLKKEYSQENILFYEACEELGELTDEQAVFEKVRRIYEDFISSWSPRELSLDSVIKGEIQERMINPDKDMYKNALDHIYNLMMRDSYPRFKMSEIYRTALEESGHF